MKRITTLAAAALAAAVWAMPAHAQQSQADRRQPNNIGDTNLPNNAGGTVDINTDNINTTVKKGSDLGAWNVRHDLSELTEAALTKGDLKKLANYFVDADRDRIEKSADFQKDDANLDGKIDAINSAWKAKFGHEFAMRKTKDVFADATVKFGEMGRDPQLAAEVKKNSENANPADADKTFGGKEKLEKGRDVASVSLLALADAPALTVPLIHELPASWRINVPDSIDAAKLRANLSKHLDMIADSAKWPADENQAEGLVARHVLMSLLDVDNTTGATGNSIDQNAVPAASRDNPLISPTAPASALPANR